jgi:hypothetical protein
MPSGGFNYGQMMQRAFRGMIADVLAEVAKRGLPGNHHFFISFDTTHPGVDMSAALRERFPHEMTIVLQHEFRDLGVARDRFTVTLSFSNRPETLVIPFDALKTFVDPSVEFGLKFDAQGAPDGTPPEPPPRPPAPAEAGGGSGEVVRLDRFRRN